MKVQANVSTSAESFQIPGSPDLIPDGPWKKVEGGVCAAKGFKATGTAITGTAEHGTAACEDFLLLRSRACSGIRVEGGHHASGTAGHCCSEALQRIVAVEVVVPPYDCANLTPSIDQICHLLMRSIWVAQPPAH